VLYEESQAGQIQMKSGGGMGWRMPEEWLGDPGRMTRGDCPPLAFKLLGKNPYRQASI